jgi:hypothetical protein
VIAFLDTESVGLVGPTVLIQYAVDDGPVRVHEPWRRPVRDTLWLIERFVESDAVCGFNLVFDWFHLQRLYCIFRLLPLDVPPTVEGWLSVERAAVNGPCVKPRSALDLMLHARRGPMQSLMDRDDIHVRRVPSVLAALLARELRSRIVLDGIYFSRRRDGYEWQVVEDEDDSDFPDVVLRFGASTGLKPLARHLLGAETIDFPIPDELMPEEDGWNPFGRGWVPLIFEHVAWWVTNEEARRYAVQDVDLLRRLWEHFGRPEPGDVDSILACLVGSCRWRGWAVDQPRLEAIREAAAARKLAAPRSPGEVMAGLRERLSPIEALALEDTTSATLAEVASWDGPAADFARSVTAARSAEKEEDACSKLLTVGRAHFDFKVIGALSGRMSGAGGLSAHGIPSQKKGSQMRSGFTMADGETGVLDGGDFDAFEVTLAAAAYGDEQLTEDLHLGKKIHALYGSSMFGLDYDEVKGDPDKYSRSKNAFFATIYGAQEPKIAATLGLSVEDVAEGTARMVERYPGVGRARAKVADSFCSMRQPSGIGTAVEWHDPAEYIESLFGFRRWFTLENKLCRALFDLAQDPPSDFRVFSRIKVSRRAGRVQTPGGAAQSALYAAAFNIQARAMRAAANHVIQSSGAQITKALQVRLWGFQPAGVHPWRITLMNVHDEILACHGGLVLGDAVGEVVESYRPAVPLIKMAWKSGLKNWDEK